MSVFYITRFNDMGAGLLIVEGVAPTRESAEGLRDQLAAQFPYPVEMSIDEHGVPRGYRVVFTPLAERQMNEIRTHSVTP